MSTSSSAGAPSTHDRDRRRAARVDPRLLERPAPAKLAAVANRPDAWSSVARSDGSAITMDPPAGGRRA